MSGSTAEAHPSVTSVTQASGDHSAKSEMLLDALTRHVEVPSTATTVQPGPVATTSMQTAATEESQTKDIRREATAAVDVQPVHAVEQSDAVELAPASKVR